MGNTIKTILQVLNNKALGGTITNNSDSIILADNNNYIQDFKGRQYGLPTVRYANGGHLFGDGGDGRTHLPRVGDSWRNTETDEAGTVVGYAPDVPYMGEDGKLYPTTSPVVKYNSGETLFGVTPQYTLPEVEVSGHLRTPADDLDSMFADVLTGGIASTEKMASDQLKEGINNGNWRDIFSGTATALSPLMFASGPARPFATTLFGADRLFVDPNGIQKTGRELLNGNYWNAAKSFAGDVFNGAVVGVGMYGMADDALNLAARLGSTDAKSIQFARALNKDIKGTGLEIGEPIGGIARTKLGDVEINNPNLFYRLDGGNHRGAFSKQGAYIKDNLLYPGPPKRSNDVGYTWWSKGSPYTYSEKKPWTPYRDINEGNIPSSRLIVTSEGETPSLLNVQSQNYQIGQWNGKKGLVGPREYVTPEPVKISDNVYTWEPGYGYRQMSEESPTISWEDAVSPKYPEITAENATAQDAFNVVRTPEEMAQIERFQGSSPIPHGKANFDYKKGQQLLQYDDETGTMVSKGYKKVDDVPNLKETIESIKTKVPDENVRKEFLDVSYLNAFREQASLQGIDVTELSDFDIAKILTEQYNQLSSTSSGLLKNNVLWRTWGNYAPQEYFDWQSHIGELTHNHGFWGKGNYFGTGKYGGNYSNRPYMINGIDEIGYDDALGLTIGNTEGSPELASKFMSESPYNRMVAATKNGNQNRYGKLDTGEYGIEVVTQKNEGIKSLIPDLTIGNGTTFPRDWNNPNVMRSIAPWLIGTGTAATGYSLYDGFNNTNSDVHAYGGPLVQQANMFRKGGTTTGPEVVITPDEEYNRFLNTLPDNQRLTPNEDYDTYLYWKLNGKPKNFQEALDKDMYTWDNSDNSYHGNSIAWGDDGTGYFIKPKHHDTLKYELDWFNKNIVTEEGGHQRFETPEERAESDRFRENYVLADDPNRPDFYIYKPKDQAEGLNTYKRLNDISIREKALGGHLFSLGGDDDSYRIGRYAYDIHDIPGTTLPEVTVNGYAPIILDTYYPVASLDYPMTGHSMLAVPHNNLYSSKRTDSQISKLPQQVLENLNRFIGYDFIDKSSASPTYNLITNNCADATLGALNAIFGTNESPFLFTTPGDVMDYSKKMAEKFGGRSYTPEYGMVRTIIPRNKDNYKSTARNFYKYALNHETDGFELGGYRRYYEENPSVQEYNWDKLIHGYY